MTESTVINPNKVIKIMSTQKIYLAGPEVFLPDANELFRQRIEYAASKGFQAKSPFDAGPHPAELNGIELARTIYSANCKLIEQSDIVVANCNTFRGALVDDGTAWEIGYACAHSKVIFGFIDRKIPLPEIVEKSIETVADESGYRKDLQGYLVNEDFGNSINLMLEYSIEKSGGLLTEGTFEDCLDRLAEMYGTGEAP